MGVIEFIREFGTSSLEGEGQHMAPGGNAMEVTSCCPFHDPLHPHPSWLLLFSLGSVHGGILKDELRFCQLGGSLRLG